jgi:hypothetical protein
VQTLLAFAPSTKEPALLVAEAVIGAPKDFILARTYDVNERKETRRITLLERDNKTAQFPAEPDPSGWRSIYGYFTSSGEPRVVFVANKDPKCMEFAASKEARVFDPATGKELRKFDVGTDVRVAPNGKTMALLKPKGGKLAVEIWSLEGE